MELISNLGIGFGVALTWQNLLYCAIGVSVGTLIGVLPGIGPLGTIAGLYEGAVDQLCTVNGVRAKVVASTATNWFGHEGTILRFVFGHSIALACLVGLLVMLQAYVLTGMIVH